MKLITNSTPARHLMFAAGGAFLCAFASVTGVEPAGAQPSEEVIIRAPDIVRRPLPRTGPGASPGLTNPEIISLTRAVSYSDLDLSTPSGQTELRARITNTARDVCQELNRLYPRTGGQYVYSSADCVQKATSDAMDVYNVITAAARR